MGSNAPDTGGFQPIDLADFGLPLDTPVDPTSTTRQTFASAPPDSPILAALGSVTDLLTVGEAVVGDVLQVVRAVAFNTVPALLGEVSKYAGDALQLFDKDQLFVMGNYSKWLPTSGIIHELLTAGLGVETEKFDGDAKDAVTVFDNMGAFVVALLVISAAVDTVGKLPLANRMPEGIWRSIQRLPEELGLGWFLGNTIEKVFDAAIGTSLQAAIKEQKLLDEPEWPIARTMLRQHILEEADLDTILKHAGYKEEWRTKIKKLETQPLPIGDIQALYQQEIVSEAELPDLLNALGFTDKVRDWLKALYIDKAETSAGAEIGSVTRTLFRNSLITEAEYRAKLAAIHYPTRLIDDDVAAINLEKSTGWRLQSVTVIKSNFLHNPGSETTAITKLQSLGYSHDDATAMVASWKVPAIHRTHGLTESQILHYLVSGVLDPGTAKTDLLAIGVDSTTADFLIAHPSTAAGSHVSKLTPALVTQAYVNGALQHSDLSPAFERAGASGEVLKDYIANAEYKYAHHHEPGSGSTPLSEQNVLQLFKLGIFDQPTATTALEGLGFSPANALLLLEIENKGPIREAMPPAFPSVLSALQYLEGLGFTFMNPVQPYYEAALMMVESAGYSPIPPAGFTPPTYNPTYPGGDKPPISPGP